MGKHLNIKLDIAGKPYEMAIDATNEEVYRLAAREINNRLASAQLARVDGFGVQDYLVSSDTHLITGSTGQGQCLSCYVQNGYLRILD